MGRLQNNEEYFVPFFPLQPLSRTQIEDLRPIRYPCRTPLLGWLHMSSMQTEINEKRTDERVANAAGSLYHCGRVGRGVQPLF